MQENSEVGLLEYFNGDELAVSVFSGKYKEEKEKIPDDMHRRMAKEFARIELNYQKKGSALAEKHLGSLYDERLSNYGRNRKSLTEESIYQLFKDFKYIVPQGRVMAGLGVNESYRSLSNCLRLPSPLDSYSSIMYSDTMLVSAAKRGCGYGLGISNLRPIETGVKNAASTSTGAISFMERFSNSTREVGQNSRRGACLLDIDIRHPDVEKFIDIKKDLTKVTGANISIFLHDDFMKAVELDADYFLRWPCNSAIEVTNSEFEYNKLIPLFNGYVKKVKAKELWNKIVDSARTMAEPGIFFRNRMTDYSPSNVYEKYFEDGTNACGEQPMAIFDTCRLMLLNLFSFVKNPFTDKAEIDFDLLYKMAYEQQRLTDDLVDLEIEYQTRIIDKILADPEPLEQKQIELTLWENVRDMAKSGRRTGCGITGLGDMLAALGLKYDSDEALEITDKVMAKKMEAELDCTIDLAILRGTFEGWSWDKEFSVTKGNNDFYQMLQDNFPVQVARMCDHGRRNINWSTIAPAGSVSILTQTTSGCEPLFQPFYMRRKKINPNDKDTRVDFIDQNGDSWTEFPVLHPKFKQWIEISITNDGEIPNLELWDKKDYQEAFEKSPWYQSTANDIDWKKRIQMQSILQKYTTSAISSTLNLPSTVTHEEVSNIYMEAWKQGLKGATIYVDGSRSGVLVSETKPKEVFEQHDAPKRPKELECDIYSVTAKGKKWNVIVGLMDKKPYEVFALEHFTNITKANLVKIKSGNYNLVVNNEVYSENITSEMTMQEENDTRLISTALRHGASITYIVEQLNKTQGDITSFNKAIARTLKKYIPEGTKSTVKCLDCGSESVIFEEGCQKCQSCGSSKCG